MRIASRHMPRYISKPIGAGGWLALFFLTGLTLWCMITKPLLLAAAVILFIPYYAVVRPRLFQEEQQLIALAALRADDSICEFARQFDCRKVDTWVIRAVYEQLQMQLRHVHPAFPVRAGDRLKEDLFLDDDDLEMDLAQEIEERTGRSLKDFSANPYRSKVVTVNDLVLFFQAQPKAESAT